MRLFIAIPLPMSLQNQVSVTLRSVKEVVGGRWVPVGNLHCTLYFAGEGDEQHAQLLTQSMNMACRTSGIFPATLQLGAAGAFMSRSRNRREKSWTWWIGIRPDEPVKTYHRILLEELKTHGNTVSVQSRFLPHITLARDVPVPPEEFILNTQPFTVTAPVLFESRYHVSSVSYYPLSPLENDCNHL